MKSKKHEKAAARLQASAEPAANGIDGEAQAQPSQSFAELRKAKLRPAALLTYQTRSLLLSPVFTNLIVDTKANVERRSALTARERELEMEEPAVEMAPVAEDGTTNGLEDEDADGEEKIYNPLKLPLGWDGKPIPYWLYKLHGLGQEFECEICSGFKYMGRKTFEKHFQVRTDGGPIIAILIDNYAFALPGIASLLRYEGPRTCVSLGELLSRRLLTI